MCFRISYAIVSAIFFFSIETHISREFTILFSFSFPLFFYLSVFLVFFVVYHLNAYNSELNIVIKDEFNFCYQFLFFSDLWICFGFIHDSTDLHYAERATKTKFETQNQRLFGVSFVKFVVFFIVSVFDFISARIINAKLRDTLNSLIPLNGMVFVLCCVCVCVWVNEIGNLEE